MANYLAAVSLSKEEFDEKKLRLSDSKDAILTSPQDVKRIENILDLSDGILEGHKFYISKITCNCGRDLSFYDTIFTALVEQWHEPSFLAHTLVGSKYFINPARPIRCSNCGGGAGRLSKMPIQNYETPKYGCCLWN